MFELMPLTQFPPTFANMLNLSPSQLPKISFTLISSVGADNPAPADINMFHFFEMGRN